MNNAHLAKSSGPSAPDVIRSIYNEKAAVYDEKRLRTGYQLRFDLTERRILRRYLSGFKQVLEVGGGTGRLTGELLACSKQVTVVDLSERMLEKLAEKFPNKPSLKLHILNAYELGSLREYGEYDALLSMRMLPHIEDIPGVLKIFRNAVRPGGTIMVDFWNRNSYVYWKKKGSAVYNNYVNYGEAKEMITRAGLKLITFYGAGFGSPLEINLEFLGRTPMKRFAYSLVAICERPK